MENYATSLCRAALTAIAVASFAVPTLAVARAVQLTEQTHAAKVYLKKHVARTSTEHRELYGSARLGCTWPYQNQFPPCMSTSPAGDPHYHGSRPGPTFNN
jgi:hypothetical protein